MGGGMASLVSTGTADREGDKPVIGSPVYSDWYQVAQRQVDAFGVVTQDDQWIHGKNATTECSPFGEPIAHGLLLLSLILKLARDCGGLPDATWVLYGFDKVRFRAPVRCGTRVRCRTTIQGVQEISKQLFLKARFVMEIKGQKIPALVTDCLLVRLNLGPRTRSAEVWQSLTE
jgi:acyl dehydratase